MIDLEREEIYLEVMTGDVTTRGSGAGGQYRVFGGTGGGQGLLLSLWWDWGRTRSTGTGHG